MKSAKKLQHCIWRTKRSLRASPVLPIQVEGVMLIYHLCIIKAGTHCRSTHTTARRSLVQRSKKTASGKEHCLALDIGFQNSWWTKTQNRFVDIFRTDF